ncbi:unnamed protein product [Dovyalis caffra]|uniref:Uncharacterized protein n=1 Tax=Dovyalis caffra TaxID=77055 RepID=A0AAV1SHE8_9ROSI|nr:unnamed protein product [Dovyalis caffra]
MIEPFLREKKHQLDTDEGARELLWNESIMGNDVVVGEVCLERVHHLKGKDVRVRNVGTRKGRANGKAYLINGQGVNAKASRSKRMIITALPLLKFHDGSLLWLFDGTINKTYLVLDIESHEHCMTPSTIILSIRLLCDKHKAELV